MAPAAETAVTPGRLRRAGGSGLASVVGAAIIASGAGFAVAAAVAADAGTTPAEGSLAVEIVLDAERQTELAPNYIAFDAFVTDAATGRPVEREYALRATVRSGDVVDETVYHLAYPFRENPATEPGHYPGVVIVPSGGEWTIAVSVFDRFAAETETIPVTLARDELTLTVDAPTLLSAAATTAEDESSGGVDRSELVLRIAHSLVALLWFAVAGILAAAGTSRPLVRCGELGELLERHLGRLVVALVWITVLLWLTGVLSLRIATAFSPPLSPDQATALFRAPYARAYTITLWVKIAVAVALTVATVPLVRRARRVVARRAGPGAAEPVSPSPMPLLFAVGGAVILVCVSILTYVHTVSERVAR